MKKPYSEKELEYICILYNNLDAQIKLSDSVLNASRKCNFDILSLHKEDVKNLIDKVKEYGLLDISIFRDSVEKLRDVYCLE